MMPNWPSSQARPSAGNLLVPASPRVRPHHDPYRKRCASTTSAFSLKSGRIGPGHQASIRNGRRRCFEPLRYGVGVIHFGRFNETARPPRLRLFLPAPAADTIYLDPPVGEEHLQPVPMVGDSSPSRDFGEIRARCRRATSRPRAARSGPGARPATARPGSMAYMAAIRRSPSAGDRGAVAVVDAVRPTVTLDHPLARAPPPRCSRHIPSTCSLPWNPSEKAHRVAAAAAGRVEEHHAGRIRTGPGPLIAGQRPQVPRLGLAPGPGPAPAPGSRP